jgi:excinuclease ABC subunit A
VYVLDEPTTGLHFEDIRKLLIVLESLVDKGNTVIVIEHNLDVIKTADWIIDMGPDGGHKGGMIVAVGTPEEVAETPVSYTGEWLRHVLGLKGTAAAGPVSATVARRAAKANGSKADGARGNGGTGTANGARTGGAPANGREANGVTANGTAANGVPANGTAANGTAANGVTANGTAANGVTANGTAANGTTANGRRGSGGSGGRAASKTSTRSGAGATKRRTTKS